MSKNWHIVPSKLKPGNGVQIDMLIDRNDNIINICEMKFSKDKYVITQVEQSKIVRRENRLSQFVAHRKSIINTMVTGNGLSKTNHWNDAHNIITADDLFQN